MDSVVIFFGAKTFEQVEDAAKAFGFENGQISRGAEHFLMWRYDEPAQALELEAEGRAAIERMLGAPIASAFQVLSRHGPNSRLALAVLADLMSHLGPAVLDDDFGGIWAASDLHNCLSQSPSTGIYDLRALPTSAN